jgi:PAS domain S-box-containing protein
VFEGIDLLDTVERLSIPSYAVDRQGIIRWINPAAETLAGAVAGRHFADVVVPAYRARARGQFLRKLHDRDATDFELEIVDADGRRVLADVSSVPVLDGRQGGRRLRAAAPRARSRADGGCARADAAPGGCAPSAGGGRLDVADPGGAAPESRDRAQPVRHLLRALGVHSRLEAVALARRSGLID